MDGFRWTFEVGGKVVLYLHNKGSRCLMGIERIQKRKVLLLPLEDFGNIDEKHNNKHYIIYKYYIILYYLYYIILQGTCMYRGGNIYKLP